MFISPEPKSCPSTFATAASFFVRVSSNAINSSKSLRELPGNCSTNWYFMILLRLRQRLLLQRVNQAFENQASVRRTQQRFARALGMRHQAGDVPGFVADASD